MLVVQSQGGRLGVHSLVEWLEVSVHHRWCTVPGAKGAAHRREELYVPGGQCQVGWGDLGVVMTCMSWALKDRWDTVRQRRREGHCRWKQWRERVG